MMQQIKVLYQCKFMKLVTQLWLFKISLFLGKILKYLVVKGHDTQNQWEKYRLKREKKGKSVSQIVKHIR